MPWIVGGAIVASTIYSSKKGKEASKEQTKGLDKQVAELRRQFDLIREDYAPFREAQLDFTKQYQSEVLGTGPSQFETSPGYKFRMGEAEKAVNRMASKQGMLNTPGQQKALYRYSQGIASDEYQNFLNNLRVGAGMTPTATAAMTSATQPLGSQIASTYGDIGASRASASINQANALTNAINQGSMLYGYRYGQTPPAPQATPTTQWT
jgi:hypothetical protein